MDQLRARFDELDRRVTGFMARNGILALRLSVAFVFIWFGGLKLVPQASPAEQLVIDTTEALTLGIVDTSFALTFLAIVEVSIGLGLLVGRYLRVTLALLGAQMVGTLAPLVLFPSRIWVDLPFTLTLEGQYIFKNAVIIAAGLVIGATVRGGRIVVEPSRMVTDDPTARPDDDRAPTGRGAAA